MKFGVSFAITTPFPSVEVGERADGVHDRRVGVRRRDHFEQTKVAWRIEEVRAEPVPSEVV